MAGAGLGNRLPPCTLARCGAATEGHSAIPSSGAQNRPLNSEGVLHLLYSKAAEFCQICLEPKFDKRAHGLMNNRRRRSFPTLTSPLDPSAWPPKGLGSSFFRMRHPTRKLELRTDPCPSNATTSPTQRSRDQKIVGARINRTFLVTLFSLL